MGSSGIPYSLKNVLPPTEEEVRRAEEILRIKLSQFTANE